MMTKRLEIYKCEICGNIVEVIHQGAGKPVCCGKPMVLVTENTEDASREKHVPVVERMATGVKVAVGSIPHPMDEGHFIEWIQVIADGKAFREFLEPGDVPEAVFRIEAHDITARGYCDKHGLWKTT
jgi:superoxide reductase